MKFYLLSALLFLLAGSRAALCSQINTIDFKTLDTETLVEISGDGLSGYAKEEKKSPPQLVLTFENATLAEQAKQKFDLSTLGKGILQVSSYAVSGGKVRVVLDFSKMPNYTVEDADQKITLHVLASSKNAVSRTASAASKISDNDTLTTIMSSEKNQKFTGSPITLKLKDADVHDVLRMISETSGFNIVINPLVTGKITVSLEQVPWDQALDVVLTTLKLSAERNESVLRIMPRDVLTKEKQDELDSKKLISAAAPRVTRIFPVSYADLPTLATLLTTFTNSQNTAPGASGIAATILVDANTQSLIVRDTAESVERMRKMIQLLDVQTPQVLIEAKVVEASEDFSKTLEGQVGIGGAGNGNSYGIGLNGSAPSTAGTAGGGGGGAAAGSGSASNKFNLSLGGTIGITASLTYAEKLSKAKVVSSPKTVVLSGKSSVINQTTAFGYTVQNPGAAGIAPTTSVVSAQANTKLDVTPRVTNDGSVFMKLNLSRDVLNLSNTAAPVAEPRTMSTEVIVESGNTLVIGGVLNIDENSSETGVPILRKIPILGWLFGSETNVRSKRELMFFITPRILNQRKTALGDNSAPDEGSKL